MGGVGTAVCFFWLFFFLLGRSLSEARDANRKSGPPTGGVHGRHLPANDDATCIKSVQTLVDSGVLRAAEPRPLLFTEQWLIFRISASKSLIEGQKLRKFS